MVIVNFNVKEKRLVVGVSVKLASGPAGCGWQDLFRMLLGHLLHRVELLLLVETGDQKFLGSLRIPEDREAGLHVPLVEPRSLDDLFQGPGLPLLEHLSDLLDF